MGKRGVSHIDWVISMGIFIVYVILLIVFLKPGVSPINKPEGLITLLEQKFFEETTWVVRESVIDITNCAPVPVDGGQTRDDCRISVSDKLGNWKFKSVNLDKDFEPRLNVGSCVIFGLGSVTCKGGNPCTGDLTGSFSDKKMKLVYSPNPDTNKNRAEKLEITPTTNTVGLCEIKNIGTSVETVGVNKNLVNDLKIKDYSYFKQTWGFPSNRDFKIEVIDASDTKNIFARIGSTQDSSEGANVFVKRINNFYLDSSNGKENIIVHIEVW